MAAIGWLCLLQVIFLTSLPAQEAKNADRIVVQDAAGWAISIGTDGSAVIFRPDDLDISTTFPAATYSFARISAGLTIEKNRPAKPEDGRYSAAFQTGACELQFYWTDRQDLCGEIFQKAIQELAGASSEPALKIRAGLAKSQKHSG
jgi:hypothetical protein